MERKNKVLRSAVEIALSNDFPSKNHDLSYFDSIPCRDVASHGNTLSANNSTPDDLKSSENTAPSVKIPAPTMPEDLFQTDNPEKGKGKAICQNLDFLHYRHYTRDKMEKEDARSLFQSLFAASLKSENDKQISERLAQQSAENERRELIRRYDEEIYPQIEKAVHEFINTGPIVPYLEVFYEAMKSIAKQENIKSDPMENIHLNSHVDPNGYNHKSVADDKKIEIVRFMDGSLVSYNGRKFTGDSVRDLITSIDVNFSPDIKEDYHYGSYFYINETLHFRPGIQDDDWELTSNRMSEFKKITTLEVYAQAMAERVAKREYWQKHVHVEDVDISGGR